LIFSKKVVDMNAKNDTIFYSIVMIVIFCIFVIHIYAKEQTQQRIAETIKNGVDPIKATCAFDEKARDSKMCTSFKEN